ncbi:DJ-1/PfpI family protein [Pseudonocardia charpentierae]|uniref:DJ-1/PfpI family protein n=1 Tax=Pseudonocardia charpentierae TaxID=3075545 RepID=A0ABU2NHH2_9PSEU|nr:DJ-1/PfpI family protein [Pseudonocardia sp. DSM 45834]MDT0353411.1 DJ-1/PfpI family protein [Pseudonocardia sp. DSM 45834]
MNMIGVLAFDGAEELDVVGPWEVLTASSALLERDGAPPDQVLLVAAGLEPVRCRKGMRLLPDATFADHPRLDVVVVPGGDGTLLASADRLLLDWLARVGAEASWVASVCTGALLLHASGLAAGKRLATHRVFEDRLTELGADVVRDARWVADGNVVSSQGVSAGIDMALWLVGQLHSPRHARATQRYIQYDPAPPYQADV